MHLQYKTTTTSYWNYRDKDKEGLTIQKPVPVELIKKVLPKVKALAFEFQKTAFKKKGVDHNKYLQEVLTAIPLEYVEISGSNQIKKLPDWLLKQQLHTFKLRNCPNISDFSELGNLTSLSTIHISGNSYQLGSKFYQLPRLMDLRLSAYEIKDIDELPKLNKLRHLQLFKLNVSMLPIGLEQLTKLKVLNLRQMNELTELPYFKSFSQLEQLYCYQLPKLAALPDDFEQLEKLKIVTLVDLGTNQKAFTIAPSLINNDCLEELSISNCPIPELPNTFSKKATLKKIYLNNLPIVKMPSTFGQLDHLETLNITACPNFKSFNGTINHLKQLRILYLKQLPELAALDFDFHEIPTLAHLALTNLPKMTQLPNFGYENKALQEIELAELMQLKTLPETLAHCEMLKKLNLSTIGISAIPKAFSQLNFLNHFGLYNAPNLNYFPSNLINIGRSYFSISNIAALQTAQISVSKIVNYARKMVASHLHPTIAYWLFENFGKEPLTEKIKKETINILSIANSDLQMLIQQNLKYLNTDKLQLGDEPISQNELVTIIGTTQNSRSFLRKELKALGFQYKMKLSRDVKYVLVGKKPPVNPDLWKSPRLLFSEQAFIAYQKKHNPGLLQKEDTPIEFIENLRQLIWSNNPTNELIALQLVKNNGFPEGLDMDFIVAAKTGKDKSVRNKIRRFLKGCLKNGALQVLNDRAVMTRSYESFYCYNGKVSNPKIAQMVVAYYKRFSKYGASFFRYDDGTSPYRKEMLAAILPSFLEKSKYLKINANLTVTELNQVLANPIFQGKLERVVIYSKLMKTIPKEIFKHQTIKDLELHGAFETSTLPPELFGLYKLNKLKLYWHTLTHIAPEIEQLNRLRELYIYTTHTLVLPNSFKHLTKLKRGHFSKGMEESLTWGETMSTVKFK